MSAPLTFASAPLGLEPLVDFSLDSVDGADGLYSLTSAANDDVRLYLIDASVHLPDYSPTITDEQCDVIGLTSAEDASVLVVVNPGDGDSSTVNLLAPIVVNMRTGACDQFILEGQDWPLRAPLA